MRAILILFIVFGSIWLSHHLRYTRKRMELKLNAEREFSKGLKTELEEIRERLANLEKIVTDKGYRLREEIDKL
ncbi:hypothetical protein F6455_09610 [Proteobacteria bacterium 005FR1]|nr:hypothetical protein [Proteobacteria bacterium 005FR1]